VCGNIARLYERAQKRHTVFAREGDGGP
jgi:hypothetical protein